MTPILIALITAFVSLVGLIISKENKTSEFRQTWIDELRKDVAEYIAMSAEHAFYYMHSWTQINQDETNAEEHGDYYPADAKRTKINEFFAEESHVVDTLHSRIILRLNPTEHEELLTALHNSYNTYVSFLNAESGRCRQELNTQLGHFNKELRNITVKVLGATWKKVKEGEPYFNKAKKIAGIVVVLLIALLITSVFTSFDHPLSPASGKLSPPQPQPGPTQNQPHHIP